MMKVMVMVKASPSSEAGEMPSQQLMLDMAKFNESLVKAGIMEAGEGLKPSHQGLRVRFSGRERLVTKGPFTETNELVAGYWIWNVDSLDEALTWVKKCPNPMTEDSEIEIRPLFEMSDFADIDVDNAVKIKEEQLRSQIANRHLECNTYLFLNGQCEQAVEYYQMTLGATLHVLMRFSECPEALPEGMLSNGFDKKIMHCEFTVGNTRFLATDHSCQSESGGGFSLTLTVNTIEEAHRIFNALADGGVIQMPLSKTFWSPLYGQVTDKFGISWMVMLPGKSD